MTITELISALEAVRAEHGDLRVAYRDWEGGGFWALGSLRIEQLTRDDTAWLEYALPWRGPGEPVLTFTD